MQSGKILILGLSIVILMSLFLGGKISISKKYRLFLGGLIIFAIINIVSSQDMYRAFLGSIERGMGWTTLFGVTLFVIFLRHIYSRDTVHRVYRVMICVGYVLSCMAILQKYHFFPGDFLASTLFEGRSGATLGQYNTLGALFVLLLGLHLSCVRHFFGKILGTCLFLFGIWCTGSDVALVGSMLLLGYFFITKKLLIVCMICLGAGGIGWYSISSLPEASRASLSSRYLLWGDAMAEISTFSFGEILIGRGADQVDDTLLRRYGPKYLAYESIDTVPDRAHNTLIDIFIQFGGIGCLVFVYIFFVVPARKFLTSETSIQRDIAFICCIHFLVMGFNFYDPVNLGIAN